MKIKRNLNEIVDKLNIAILNPNKVIKLTVRNGFYVCEFIFTCSISMSIKFSCDGTNIVIQTSDEVLVLHPTDIEITTKI